VNTIQYLSDPTLRQIYLPGIFTGLGIAVMCAVLSPLVVLKRLSFVGQGISHAAFGGLGVAAIVALLLGGTVPAVSTPHAQFTIVLGFCLLSAGMIGWLTDRGSRQADTAIGIVLVGAMALGAILIQFAMERGVRQMRGWESILFGDVFSVGRGDAQLAWIVAACILVVLWAIRRRMLFWAFDEAAAPAFGVPATAMKYVLITLLAVAIVTAMKLAGVVLATALLVLPAAAALRLSDRLTNVVAISAAVAMGGVLAGLTLSFEMNLPPGACIVAVLVTVFAAARIGRPALVPTA
jgi:ABC-type Mn2+/Zn2+ transport system permease subunit